MVEPLGLHFFYFYGTNKNPNGSKECCALSHVLGSQVKKDLGAFCSLHYLLLLLFLHDFVLPVVTRVLFRLPAASEIFCG